MQKQSGKKRRAQFTEMQNFVFEIEAWKPEYSWSVNQDKFADAPYREYLTIDLHTNCIFPAKFAGRQVLFALLGDRCGFVPTAFQRDPEWRPRCVGLLSLRPGDAHFYVGVPLENFGLMVTAMAHGLFRFISVYGPPLRYGKSECSSITFLKSVNLADY